MKTTANRSAGTKIRSLRSATVLSGAILWSSSLVFSAESHAFSPGLHCNSGGRNASCEVRITPSLTLSTPAKAVKDSSNPHRIALHGGLVVVRLAMELPLAEAQLVVTIEYTGKGQSELYGVARAPKEKLALLSEANLDGTQTGPIDIHVFRPPETCEDIAKLKLIQSIR